MTMWRARAACKDMDPTIWFPPPEHAGCYGLARQICTACPVRTRCLAEAMAYEAGAGPVYRNGMFGGLTPHERYDLSRGRYRERHAACAVCTRLFDPGYRGKLCCSEDCRKRRSVLQARALRRERRAA